MPQAVDVDVPMVDEGSTTDATIEPGGSRYERAYEHYRSGIAHFEQGEYAEAVREFSETIRWKPDSAQSFHWRAKAWIELGQLARALGDMNRAVALRPRDPIALHARAVVLDRLGRLESARADMVEALRLSPGNRACLAYLNRLQARTEASSLAGVAAHGMLSSYTPGY